MLLHDDRREELMNVYDCDHDVDVGADRALCG